MPECGIELLAPRIYAAGPMFTAPGGHPVAILETLAPWWIRWYLLPRVTRQVSTSAEARAAVAEVVGHSVPLRHFPP